MGNSQAKGQVKSRQKKQVHWKSAERPGPPGKPELVSGGDITPDVVTIRWDKPKSDGGTLITGYLVEHRRTGSPHWVRATPLLVTAPELTLSGLEPGWRYQFRITAQNVVGMSDPGDISEPLTVTLQRSIITAPKFTEELKETTALENEMAEFVVHMIGQPPPKICWFKDGFEIFSSRRTRIITENDKSVLTIHQVALADEGEIKCTATNKAGHISTKCVVKVEAPPVIRLPRQYEDGLLFELDEVMRLKVSIAGRPQPLIFWSHNGETIQNNDRYEITDTDKSSVLKVCEAKRSDRGEYQIRAVNQLGEDSTSFLVTVTDKPRPPTELKVIMSLGKTVTLSWNLPEDDGGCKIGNYIVEYYRLGWNVWLKASTCRQLTTTLSDLIEGSEYKFRVKAESPYGVSDPSDETDVIFVPDPKRGLLAPPPRSRSQHRHNEKEIEPVPPKRRSTSSTRQANKEQQQSTLIPANLAPTPPKREKVKSPQRSPESSPLATRKYMFDRSSLTRELSYGSPPDDKYKRPHLEPKPVEPPPPPIEKSKTPSPTNTRDRSSSLINQLLPNKERTQRERSFSLINQLLPNKDRTQRERSPGLINQLLSSKEPPVTRERSPSIINQLLSINGPSTPRERSPSIINTLLSNILPSKKSPSSTPTPSPPQENSSPANTPSPVAEHKEPPLITSSLKGDHLDRLSPNIVNRRLSSPMLNTRETSPSPRGRSPSLGDDLLDRNSTLSPMQRSKSPSPSVQGNRSPSLGDGLLDRNSTLSPMQRSKSPSPSVQGNRSPNLGDGLLDRNSTLSPMQRSKSPSPSVQGNRSPSLGDGLLDRNSTLSPMQRSKSPSPSVQGNRSPSPSRYAVIDDGSRRGSLQSYQNNNNNLIHGSSSEFMLVLVDDQSGANYLFEDSLIPPPLSLSAPELGAESELFMPLKTSVSSTELLHERAFARFAKEAEDDSKTAARTGVVRRASFEVNEKSKIIELDERRQGIPKILINSKDNDDIVGLERISSFTRRLSAGVSSMAQQYLWSRRRQSLQDTAENSDLYEIKSKYSDTMKDVTRERSISEEKEEISKVRPKMANNEDNNRNNSITKVEENKKRQESIDEESISPEEDSEESEDERLKFDLSPPQIKAQEEETYHPRRMMLPTTLSKYEEPFEILTKPLPMPDPNVVPKKPILKRKEPEAVKKRTPEKPARKFLNNQPDERPVSPFLTTSASDRSRSPSPSPSRVLMPHQPSPVPMRSIQATQMMAAGEAAKEKRLRRQSSEEEYKVVADHYMDLVREYGGSKKPLHNVYLNRDDLKPASDEESPEQSKENLNEPPKKETSPVRTSSLLARHEANRATRRNPSPCPPRRPLPTEIKTPETKPLEIKPPETKTKTLRSRSSSRTRTRDTSATRTARNTSSSRTTQREPSGTRTGGRDVSATRTGRTVKRDTSATRNVKRQISNSRTVTPTSLHEKLMTISRTPSPRPLTPEQEAMQAEAEIIVRSTMDYLTDLAMFTVACWLYLFKDARLAIPILIIMVYRQVKDEVKNMMPEWMIRNKKQNQ